MDASWKECLATPLDLIVALCAFFTLCFCFPTKISHLLILHFSYLNARSPAKKCISGMTPYGNNLFKFIDPLHGCIKMKKKVFEFLVFAVIFFVKNFNFNFIFSEKKEFGKFHQNTRIMFDANASLKCSNNASIVCKNRIALIHRTPPQNVQSTMNRSPHLNPPSSYRVHFITKVTIWCILYFFGFRLCSSDQISPCSFVCQRVES